jgi:hypothetical protein
VAARAQECDKRKCGSGRSYIPSELFRKKKKEKKEKKENPRHTIPTPSPFEKPIRWFNEAPAY